MDAEISLRIRLTHRMGRDLRCGGRAGGMEYAYLGCK